MNINYLLILILIMLDLLNINKLWNENYHRRILHHLERGIYNPSKTPEIYLNQKLIPKHIEYLQTLKYPKETSKSAETISPILSNLVSGIYSTKSNLFSINFNKNTQDKLEEIANYYIPHFSKVVGKQLYLTKTKDKIFILRYHGNKSSFPWHYDNEHISCYRALFIFKKDGKVPLFKYIDKNNKTISIDTDIGDGLIFKGKNTFHGVNKLDNEQFTRYIISFQYTTEPNHTHKSLCSELSFVTPKKIIKVFLPKILPYWIIALIVYILGKQANINLKINIISFIIIIIGLTIGLLYLPNKMPINIGTKINKTPSLIVKYFIILLIHIIYPIETIIYVYYILITESIFPSTIVNKHILNP
jgi:hypothetical protein